MVVYPRGILGAGCVCHEMCSLNCAGLGTRTTELRKLLHGHMLTLFILPIRPGAWSSLRLPQRECKKSLGCCGCYWNLPRPFGEMPRPRDTQNRLSKSHHSSDLHYQPSHIFAKLHPISKMASSLLLQGRV